MQSQIFGETSAPSGDEPSPALVAPGEMLLEPEALADPLYSQTTFLDPASSRGGAANAPPLPDLLADAPLAEPDADDETALAEADTALDEELEATRYEPTPQPFSPDTAAALDEPHFERGAVRAEAATRLMLPQEREPETPVPTRISPLASAARGAGPAHGCACPPGACRPSAARSCRSRRGALERDRRLALSRRASRRWPGKPSARSEQVVGEVLKRVEAVGGRAAALRAADPRRDRPTQGEMSD
jgi:hypothetical protein